MQEPTKTQIARRQMSPGRAVYLFAAVSAIGAGLLLILLALLGDCLEKVHGLLGLLLFGVGTFQLAESLPRILTGKRSGTLVRSRYGDPDYYPPLRALAWSATTMVVSGLLLILLAALFDCLRLYHLLLGLYLMAAGMGLWFGPIMMAYSGHHSDDEDDNPPPP